MKGAFPEELVWTAIVLVAVLVIAFLGFVILITAFGFTGKSPLSSTIEFVVSTDRPYALAGTLTYFRPDDRSFLEHAVEISYSSLENASSRNLPKNVSDFLKKYNFAYSSVRITKDEKYVADISTSINYALCGSDLEGFCVAAGLAELNTYKYHACGVGRIKIEEDKNKCPKLSGPGDYFCCKPDEEGFKKKYPGVSVRSCGQDFRGVCNAKKGTKANPDDPEVKVDFCGEGVPDYSAANDCKNVNNGETPVCCLYGKAAAEEREISGFTSTAQIPLLYKDGFGYAEVTTG